MFTESHASQLRWYRILLIVAFIYVFGLAYVLHIAIPHTQSASGAELHIVPFEQIVKVDVRHPAVLKPATSIAPAAKQARADAAPKAAKPARIAMRVASAASGKPGLGGTPAAQGSQTPGGGSALMASMPVELPVSADAPDMSETPIADTPFEGTAVAPSIEAPSLGNGIGKSSGDGVGDGAGVAPGSGTGSGSGPGSGSGTSAGSGSGGNGTGGLGGNGGNDGTGSGDGAYVPSGSGLPYQLAGIGSVAPKRVVYLLDKSPSMAPKIKAAEAEVLAALQTLTVGDKFDIVLFDWRTSYFNGSLVDVTPKTLHDAEVFLGAQAEKRGGTNVEKAVRASIGISGVQDVVVITDGLPNIGETGPTRFGEVIAQNNPHHVRVSTVGLFGWRYDDRQEIEQATVLLSNLAHDTGGSSRVVEVQ